MQNGKEEQVLTGILPKHLTISRFVKVMIGTGIAFLIIFAILFGISISNKLPDISSSIYYLYIELGALCICGVAFLLWGILHLLFLRKCGFDDWVLEIANKYLGTQVIFYTHNRLFIEFSRTGKEVDKRDFVSTMSDLSDHFSYFYINTYIDLGYIEVVVTPKQPVPTVAPYKFDESRKDWNNIYLGLSINNTTLKVAPLTWKLNDNIKDDKLLNTLPSTSLVICGGTGGGKSVTENGIVSHISHFSDNIMMIGVDMKKVEFNLLQGVKGVVGVALEVDEARDAFVAFYQLMDKRYKFMATAGVNNVYNIRNLTVNYYTLFGREYQFDEIFCVWQDLDKTDRNYEKMAKLHPDGRCQTFMTIEDIYNGLKNNELRNPKLVEYRGYNSYIKDGDIKKTTGEFKVKAMILLIDEMNALMSSDDYRALDDIKTALGQILRLGRAAGVHVCIAAQSITQGTINSDQMNNIQQRIIVGGFDDGASARLFDKDISNRSKPQIKGRGFCMSGNEFYETQFFFFKQARDFVFDEDRLDTYNNKIFKEQKFGDENAEVPKECFDGFVEQVPNEYIQEVEEEPDDEFGFYGYGREPKTPSRKKKQFTDTFAISKNTKEVSVDKGEEVVPDIREEIGEEKKIFTIKTDEVSKEEGKKKITFKI